MLLGFALYGKRIQMVSLTDNVSTTTARSKLEAIHIPLME